MSEHTKGPVEATKERQGAMMRISPVEQAAIRQVLAAGRDHGYGNMISHLRTAWAAALMRDYGMSEKDARCGAGGDGYPFGMQQDLVERGEWDETGKAYRPNKPAKPKTKGKVKRG